MNPARRRLFEGVGGGTVLLLLSACGGGGGDTSATPAAAPAPAAAPPPVAAATCGATAISANHGHALVIPSADLDSVTSITYSIRGTADHDHSITLTPAQLAQIKAAMSQTVVSTTTLSHAHDVTVNCG